MVTDLILLRLRRLCWFVGRLADLGRPVELSPEVLRGLHRSLLALLDAVNAATRCRSPWVRAMSGRPTAINGHSWPGRGDPAQYASPGRLRPAERLHERAGLVFVAAAERGRTPERWGLGVALSIVGRSLIAGELVVADDLVDRDRATRNRLDAWASSQLLDTPVGKHPLGLVTRRQYLDPDKGGFLRAYTGRGFLLTADEGRSLGLLADHWAPAAGKRWAGAFTLGLASWGEIGEWTSNGRAHRGWRPLLHRPEPA